MTKITRTLSQIDDEIKQHYIAINGLQAEKKLIQSKCPHPTDLLVVTQKDDTDEYGRLEGYTKTSKCMLCEHVMVESIPYKAYG
jgi:hypothetical protein